MEGLEGLADYATAMFSLIFYMPAILLWLATILVGAALGWKPPLWGASATRREEICASTFVKGLSIFLLHIGWLA